MIRTLHKMGIRSSMLYAAGLASIGLSVAAWTASLKYERAGIDRADRWGIFVGQWAPALFALGTAVRIEETREELPQEFQRMEREMRTPAGARA
ncbi:hypothetical protein AB0K16_51550 [Nonomuraea jabiensis]|uniref:Uncharacterized protein n=1 Tax=Nonomuraea jabiensis TaxID=882448 RepID=A0A7W9LCG6_9ACTN|nr:hypothetical protein [Nonomuraea jabiensis]MBB5778766.1 hypothetical protein [Nonomuraea jabiensis]